MNTKSARVQRVNMMFWLACGLAAGAAANTPAAEEFPYQVPFSLGKAQFTPGDQITVLSVRGTADTFRTNETYCVEGNYTLSSQDEADLSLYVTTKTDIRTETDKRQIMRVTKGKGSFRLVETMTAEGWPHVSFYPVHSGGSMGGIYFGQGDWLWTDNSASDKIVLTGANRSLFDYLGNPVEAPADLDTAYTPAGLKAAVQSAATTAGISLKKIAIDDSEFPFLIGVAYPEGDFPKLKVQLIKMQQYEYYGDVGAHNCCTFTIIPSRVWPAEARQRIYRRATLRMQVFYDRVCTLQ